MIVSTKTSTLILVGLAAAVWQARSAEVDLSKLPPPAAKKGVTYAQDVRPLLEASCVRCHGGDRPKAGLRLDSLEGVLKGGKDGKVIEPGKSEKSLLVIAVSQLDEDKAMPPKFRPGRGGPGRPGGGGQGGPPAGSSPGGAQGQPGGGGQGHPPGGPGGPGGFGPPPKPLTPEQVGIVRAWVDQGAK